MIDPVSQTSEKFGFSKVFNLHFWAQEPSVLTKPQTLNPKFRLHRLCGISPNGILKANNDMAHAPKFSKPFTRIAVPSHMHSHCDVIDNIVFQKVAVTLTALRHTSTPCSHVILGIVRYS